MRIVDWVYNFQIGSEGIQFQIFDFLPHHQLEVCNRRKWIVMLHVPRPDRLKDKVNLAQLMEIDCRYPDLILIVAHVGRAYCNEDIGNAFEILSRSKNMLFDFSANTNAFVFEQLIKTVGPKRIMFGSDLPITRMRMRRICENGMYVNLVPPGLYGDISGHKNMRAVHELQADKLTFFLYEELAAFQQAALNTKLRDRDIEDIFFGNAAHIISDINGFKLKI